MKASTSTWNQATLAAVAAVIILGLIGIILQFLYQWNIEYVASELLFLIFTLLCVLSSWMILTSVRPSLKITSEKMAGSTTSTRQSKSFLLVLAILVVSLSIAVLAVYTNRYLGIPWSGIVLQFYWLSVFVNFALVGIAICLYSLALWELYCWTSRPVNPKPFTWHAEEIKLLASEYLQVILVGVVAYLIALAGIWLSPGGRILFVGQGITRDFWIIPTACLVAAYFLLVQYFFHRMNARQKYARIESLRGLQQQAFERWMQTYDEKEAGLVEYIGNMIGIIESEKTWLLDAPRILAVLIPIFIPAMSEIADIITMIFVDG